MASNQPQSRRSSGSSPVLSPQICHDDPMTQSELEKLVDILPDDAKYHVYKTLEKKLLFKEMTCEAENTPDSKKRKLHFSGSPEPGILPITPGKGLEWDNDLPGHSPFISALGLPISASKEASKLSGFRRLVQPTHPRSSPRPARAPPSIPTSDLAILNEQITNTSSQHSTFKQTKIDKDTPQLANKSIPVVVKGIPRSTTDNPILLKDEIKKVKPNANIQNIKVFKSGDILIQPCDPHSSNILLQNWPSNVKLGKPTARLPTNKIPPNNNVVILGVHPSVTDAQIQTSLEDYGHQIVSLRRFTAKATGNPTWKIRVNFSEQESKKAALANGVYIGYSLHKCQDYHALPTVIQCYNCNTWGHHASKCTNPMKCVRCGESHKVSQCPVARENTICSNCGDSHSSAYKGCPAYKIAQQNLASKTNSANTTSRSYSDAVKSSPSKPLISFVADFVTSVLKILGFKIQVEKVAEATSIAAKNHLNTVISPKEVITALGKFKSVYSPTPLQSASASVRSLQLQSPPKSGQLQPPPVTPAKQMPTNG